VKILEWLVGDGRSFLVQRSLAGLALLQLVMLVGKMVHDAPDTSESKKRPEGWAKKITVHAKAMEKRKPL
jgi:hypothetical protein